MIAHSIDCARGSGLFDRIVVSTDDDEIASVAREFGAEIPFMRPAELADDYATTTEVIAHAASTLQAQGSSLSAICCMYATAPFMQSKDIGRGLELLNSGNWQFVFAATTYAFPIFRAFRQTQEGGVQMFFPRQFGVRSQDLQEALHDAGQFYWGTPFAWCARIKVFDTGSTIVRIPRWRVQDIDTEEDWTRAELMAAGLVDLRDIKP